MRQTRDCDHVVSQGTLRDGASRVDYYTTVPTPSQWIAVGVLIASETEDPVRRPRRMLVGTGGSEGDAVADLEDRFAYFIKGRKTHDRWQQSQASRRNRRPGTSSRPEVGHVIGERDAVENEATRI